MQCLARLLFRLNVRTSVAGVSPRVRLLEVENSLPQAVPFCGGSPECERMCFVRLPDFEKDLPHVVHRSKFSYVIRKEA